MDIISKVVWFVLSQAGFRLMESIHHDQDLN